MRVNSGTQQATGAADGVPAKSGVGRLGAGVVWIAVVAFAVLVVVRAQQPLPRWDLVACLAVAAVGLVLWLRPTSCASASSPSRTPGRFAGPPVHPRTAPPGFRAEGKWPLDNRNLKLLLVVSAVLVPLALLSVHSASTTKQLNEIRAGGAQTSEVEVMDVNHLDSDEEHGGHWRLTVTAPHEGEKLELRGEYDLLIGTIDRGDKLWGLYTPADPDAGVILASSEAALELKRELPIQQIAFLVLTLVLLSLTMMRSTLVAARGRDMTESTVASKVLSGSALVLRVRITGLRIARHQRAAALRLTAAEGERDMVFGPWVDVDLLADELDGQEAWLYWTQSPERTHLSGLLNNGSDGVAKLPCVLVLDDNTYLKGHTPAVHDGSMPPGYAIGRIDVAGTSVVRPVASRLLRRPRPRQLRIFLYGMALVLVSEMLVRPMGEYSDAPELGMILTGILAALLFAGLHAGRSRGQARRAAARRDRDAHPAP